MEKKDKNTKQIESLVLFLLFGFILMIIFLRIVLADPSGADSIVVQSNETKSSSSGSLINVSGGRLATINITATSQNVRWKGFTGQVSGALTLDDTSGSSLYDWSLTTIVGEVYATRNSSSITWSNIRCANVSILESENTRMNHSSANDNITKTFSSSTHTAFFVGAVTISANTCPTLNTYINNASQSTDFEEVALTDSTNFTLGGTLVYSTILEQNVGGFDNETYDFQMIVPENGASTWTGSTAYYLYVELG